MEIMKKETLKNFRSNLLIVLADVSVWPLNYSCDVGGHVENMEVVVRGDAVDRSIAACELRFAWHSGIKVYLTTKTNARRSG